MKTIPLTRGYSAIVDDDDFESLSKVNWYALSGRNGLFYAYNVVVGLMHRTLMNAGGSHQVDHKNGNTLDNRKENLRIASVCQNQWNAKRRKDNKSGAKGVHRRPSGKFRARIQVASQRIPLGDFDTLEDAIVARAMAAEKLHGEFAKS